MDDVNIEWFEHSYTDPQQVVDMVAKCVQVEQIGVIETTLAATGEKVRVLVGWQKDEYGGKDGLAVIPLAMLFNTSPFEVLNAPEDMSVVDKRH